MKRLAKKAIIGILAASICITEATGCASTGNKPYKNDQGYYLNSVDKADSLVDVSGDRFDSSADNGYYSKSAGVGINIKNKDVLSLIKKGSLLQVNSLGVSDTEYGFEYYYMTNAAYRLFNSIPKDASDEEVEAVQKKYDANIKKYTFPYVMVVRIPDGKDKKDADSVMKRMKSKFSHIDEIGKIGSDHYYFAYNKDYQDLKLDKSEEKSLQNLVNNIQVLKKDICIFPAETEDSRSKGNSIQSIGEFKTKALDGSDVTQKIFAENKITMINIWATYCGPCKAEMKDLGELYKSLPEGSGMISICSDGKEEPDLAKKILKKNNCDFKALLPNDKLNKAVMNKVSAVPTTIFVDANGKVVGDPIVGGRSKDKYTKEICKRLSMISAEGSASEVAK